MKLPRRLDHAVVPRLGRVLARLSRWSSGRWRLRLLTALALTGSLAILLTVALATRTSHEPQARLPENAAKVHVGVAQGQSIPGYVATARAELTFLLAAAGAAQGETYALVSLRSYLAPDRLTPVLGGVATAEVYSRVPFSQAQAQIVKIQAYRIPEDVITGMQKVAKQKEKEAEDFRLLAAKLNEVNAAEDQLRQTYLGGVAVAAAEAQAYRNACACIYAAVVRATPAALDQIAARPEVRAVDPAPEITRLDQAVFLAPLPEQRDVVISPSPSPSRVPPSPSPSPSALPPPVSPPPPAPDPTPTVGSPSPAPVPTRTAESAR
jgi:hypothetical protein